MVNVEWLWSRGENEWYSELVKYVNWKIYGVRLWKFI